MLSLCLQPPLFHIALMLKVYSFHMCFSNIIVGDLVSCSVIQCEYLFTAQFLCGENTHSLSSFTVVLLATSPAYFRGFTLIALKEGREGTTDDDYIGQFQVRISRCGEEKTESLHTDCALSFLGKFAKHLICML